MEMKFIITESKREELIDKYLSKEYGGLKKGESKNHPDLVFFIRDADHNLTGNDIVFLTEQEHILKYYRLVLLMQQFQEMLG